MYIWTMILLRTRNGQSEKQYMFITVLFANVCVRVDILRSSLILCGQLLAIWERPGVLFPSFHVPILKEREGGVVV